MTKKIELNSKKRTADEKNPKELRREGFVPGVLYGSGAENTQLKVNFIELTKAYEEAGESTLVDLLVDGKSTKVIIKDLQTDPVKDVITHVDFYQVDMSKKIDVEVPLVFVGESKSEKEQGAMIITNMETVNIKCLPGELIDQLEIDLSKLENIGDSVKVGDLELPEGFELNSNETDAIVSATERKIVEEKEEEAAEGGEEAGEDASGDDAKEGGEKKE